jgi:hypothetical protein
MRHTAWWGVAGLLVAIAGVLWMRGSGGASGSYATFTSDHLKVRFEYPANWTVREMTKGLGRRRGEVQVFGPRREDLKYSLYVDVSAEPAEGALPQLVEQALTRRQQRRSFAVLDQRPTSCDGQAAVQVLAGYDLTLPLESPKPSAVPFQELTAYCVHDAQLFRLAYAAPKEDFPQHRHAFERLVRSFEFLP